MTQMTSNGIETICKGFATTGSRRKLLKGIAGGFAAALLAAGSRSAAFAEGQPQPAVSEGLNAGGSGVAGFVVDYYQAIVARNYKKAYDLWGAGFQQQVSYDDFKATASQTALVDVTILSTHSSANNTYKVKIKEVTWHVDGSIHGATGTYTIGREGGVAKIVAVSLQEGPTPDVAPLCYAGDLSASLDGGAAAGHRYGSVTVTNEGGDACVVGGFPRVKLVDGKTHKQTLIAGVPEHGVEAQPVTLYPGDQASVELDWTNWCGAPTTGHLSVVVSLPGSFGAIKIPNNFGVPPCESSGQNSHLSVGPWS
jgi:uncharacterized protein DUF4232